MSKFFLTEPEVADNGAHRAAQPIDRNWQETWWVNWHDSAQGTGGFHHYGLQVGRGCADVWDWVAVDGEVVAFQQQLDLDSPQGHFPDYDIGSISVRTVKPLTAYGVRSRHANTEVDLNYEAYRTPVAMGVAGSDIFAHHYESMGRAQGTLRHDGRNIPFEGVAFQDHSWGPRNHGAMVSHRWFWAVFGPDLLVTAYGGYNEAGVRRVFGYLYENGTYTIITGAHFNYRIRDDGFTPAGAEMTLTTTDGRDHHISAEAAGAQPISHHDGFLMTDALARFEYRGKSGTGLIECREIGTPALWQTQLHDPEVLVRG